MNNFLTETGSRRRYDWVFWQDEDGLWRGMTRDGDIVLGACDSYSEIVKVAAVVLTQLGHYDEADALECYRPARDIPAPDTLARRAREVRQGK